MQAGKKTERDQAVVTPLGMMIGSSNSSKRPNGLNLSIEKPLFVKNLDPQEANLASILRIKMKAPVHVTDFRDPRKEPPVPIPTTAQN